VATAMDNQIHRRLASGKKVCARGYEKVKSKGKGMQDEQTAGKSRGIGGSE